MEKEFVPYDESLALKELGFDEDCFGYYVNAELDLTWKFSDCSLYQDTHISILAPLYQQAFRWLYQKLDIERGVMPLDIESQQLLLKELIDKVSSKHLLV